MCGVTHLPLHQSVAIHCVLTAQDTKALLTVTGVHFEELRVVMQFLCSLHSTLYQALAGGVPYNVSRKYYGTSLDCVSATLPLTATDPRLSA